MVNQSFQLRAGAGNTRLHGPDRRPADRGSIFVAEFLRTDQDHRLPQQWRQLPDKALQVGQRRATVLVAALHFRVGCRVIEKSALGAPAPALLEEGVSHDGVEPGLHVGAGLELVYGGKRADKPLLDEIIRFRPVPDQESGKAAQVGEQSDHLLTRRKRDGRPFGEGNAIHMCRNSPASAGFAQEGSQQ